MSAPSAVTTAAQRMWIMAEMHGRDLLRRHVALALLVALPLSFYLSSAGSGRRAIPSGGIGIAFAVAGATLFSALSSRDVDQRLVLGGYRPIELLVGRVVFLAPLGIGIACLFTAIMVAVSDPSDGWLLAVGLAAVALQAVPVGLAISSVVPRELEGTLVVIGVVGLQMATQAGSVVGRLLPFHGPRRIIDAAVSGHGPVLVPLLETAAYGLALLVVARIFIASRLVVTHRATRANRRPG